MAQQVLAVPEDLPLLRAAALMIGSGKHSLPVLRNRKVVGTIYRWDTVRALSGPELPAAGIPGDHAIDNARA